MDIQTATETQHYSKQIPYMVLKLYPQEIRELYQILLNGEPTDFQSILLEQLTKFLSDYDSGKYDKLTKEE